MYELKTKVNDADVVKFLKSVKDEKQREDSLVLLDLMTKIIKQPAKMWGPSIVGFGSYHYKYDSGHEGDMCLTGFSPRKQNLTLYIVPGFEKNKDLMKNLGKYKTSKSCLYIKRLEDVDMKVLQELIKRGLAQTKESVKKYK
jgi:hypothetical protein